MSDRTTNYPTETEEEPHDNLNLRDMVTWDPRVGNDLVIDAYKDLSYQSKLNGFEDRVEDPELRAKKFSRELSYGVTKLNAGNENPIIDPIKFSKGHGENWREQLETAANFTNIITGVAETKIQDGLMDHDQTKVEEGRILLEASVNAAMIFRDEVEFSQNMTRVQEKLLWKEPEEKDEKDDYIADGFQEDDNTTKYIRGLTGLIPEELRTPQTMELLTESMIEIIDHWQEREERKTSGMTRSGSIISGPKTMRSPMTITG